MQANLNGAAVDTDSTMLNNCLAFSDISIGCTPLTPKV
jgi:hypothetical protein